MDKRCFGEYCAFSNDCDRCSELDRYCKIWKNNMFNFKHKHNLALFTCFVVLAMWNLKIGLDFLKGNFNSFAVLSLSVVLLSLSVLVQNAKSRKKAMKAYQTYMANCRENQIKSSVLPEREL